MIITWTGKSGTDLGTAGNWNPPAVPTPSDMLNFDLGGGGVLTGTARGAQQISMASAPGSSQVGRSLATYSPLHLRSRKLSGSEIKAGTLTVGSRGTITNNGIFTFAGSVAGTHGAITVAGTGALLNGNSSVIIGNFGTGTATVGDGGIIDTVSRIDIAVFDQSNGTLNIQSGGTVKSPFTDLGNVAGSRGQ